MAGTEKRRSTEPRNTVTMGVTTPADSTFEWREVGAQVSRRRSRLQTLIMDKTAVSVAPWATGSSPRVRRQLEIEGLDEGYLGRQQAEMANIRRQNSVALTDIDFGQLKGLSAELRARLTRSEPQTLGEAGRLQGMTPAALTAIMAHYCKQQRIPS